MCVVAHPDDIEYGASGAVAMWTAAGKEVVYVLATSGEAGIDGVEPARCGPVREAEERAAAACVGVDVVEFLGHRDGTVEHTIELRRDLAGALRRHRPELVVTLNFHDTWGGGWWNSADHRNLGRALLDARADAGNRWIHTDLGLEPWGGVRWVCVSGAATPTHEVVLTEEAFDRAVRSLEAHGAYLEGLGEGAPAPRAMLEGWARGEDGRLTATFEVL